MQKRCWEGLKNEYFMKSVNFSGIRHKNKCNHLPPLSLSYAHYLLKFLFSFFLTVLIFYLSILHCVCFYLDRILNALLGFSKVFQVLTSCKKVLTFITVWWLQMVSQSGSSKFYKKQTWANKDNTCALIGQKLIIFSTGKLLAILNSHSLFYHTL